jgi:Xaa-Pro dipeptidase
MGNAMQKKDGSIDLYQLPFSTCEYRRRLQCVQKAMVSASLDALLTDSFSNICYLTGFETLYTVKPFVLLVPAEGYPTLLGEDFELHNCLTGCWVTDLVKFPCGIGETGELKQMLLDRGLAKGKIGINTGSYGVAAKNMAALQKSLNECEFLEQPWLIEMVRSIKSPEEIACIRRAAELTSFGMAVAMETVASGKLDNDVAAAAYEKIISKGSEYMCIDPIVTVGARSGIPHTTHRRVPINEGDTVFIELGACINRYSSPMMRTAVAGSASPQLRRMADACQTSVETLLENIRPGVVAGEVAVRAKKTLESIPSEWVWHGYYGYSAGLGFPPTWSDAPIFIMDNSDQVLQAGMVLHCNTSLRDIGHCGAACGETVLITDNGCEVLTSFPRELVIRSDY